MKHLYAAFLVAAAIAGPALAQAPEAPKAPTPEPNYYRLDFVVKEVEGGKVLNARAFAMTISTGNDSQSAIRTGTKLPINISSQPGNSSIQFVDVGVNIDTRRPKEVGNQLALYVSADMSTAGDGTGTGTPNTPPPIRQNRWSSNVIVPLKKPTVIFSSDDLASKRRMQLELTATPIK